MSTKFVIVTITDHQTCRCSATTVITTYSLNYCEL